MKIFLLSLLILLFSTQHLCAQTDSTILLNEAKTKLKEGKATVCDILSNKHYSSIHPNTSFRELIKTHSLSGTLAITTADEPGKKLLVSCHVKDAAGKPVAGALVYLYQTDARGWYAADAPHVLAYEGDHRHARLFGYVKTDKEGKFSLETVKPSGYPKSDLPAHIHVVITAAGYEPFGTEFLFDDDERLKGKIREDAIRNEFIIAKPEPAVLPALQKFSYHVSLTAT